MDIQPALLTEAQAAVYLAMSVKTLRNDRYTGALGISFIKQGETKQSGVKYAIKDLDAWIAAHRVAF